MYSLLSSGRLRWLLVALLLVLLSHILPALPINDENDLPGNSSFLVQIKILGSEYKVKNNRVQTIEDDESQSVINIEISGIPNYDNLVAKLNKQTKQKHKIVVKNGNKFGESGRQDETESSISNYLLVGTVLNSNVDSHLFVTGYDNKNGLPKLTYLLIKIGNDNFYLKPFHSSNSIDPNRQNFHLVEIDNQLEKNLNSEAKKILQRIRRKTNGMRDFYDNRQFSNKKPRKSCGIQLVVDYSFYLKMDKDVAKVNQFVNYAMFIANQVFRNTMFTKSGYNNDTSNEEVFTGYGLILCEVVIHQHEDDQIPYNRLGTWKTNQLFNVLSQSLGDPDFCLVHLFSNNRIEDSHGEQIIGFASIGQIFTDYNVGVTSFADYQYYQLSGIMNFVHSIGHNFGAYHDSKDFDMNEKNCLPKTDGAFLMNKNPLVTYGPNNFFLSPCSIKSIWNTIKNNLRNFIKEDYCKTCGNNILEEDEDCDDSGPCCDQKTCRLKQGASCSPVHSACCDSNCQVKPKESICAPNDLEFCLEKYYCDGFSAQCPSDTITMPDGTSCNIDEKKGGTCLNGFCRFDENKNEEER